MLVWLIVIATTILLEFLTIQLIALPFVFGAIASLIVAFLKLGFIIEMSVFIVVSIVMIYVIQKYLKQQVMPKFTATNLERIINKTVVVNHVNPDLKSGLVKLNGVTWKIICAENLVEKEIVVICEIQGTTLIVKKEN